MSRLTSYKNLKKGYERLALLYEVTMHSYQQLYDDGRNKLRTKENVNSKVDLEVGSKTKSRPLKVITYHARDVYPDLLRSTLLIRMVAIFEAFLVDTVVEISKRDLTPFMNSKRVDLSHEHLISMHQQGEVIPFIIGKVTRQLTSGGLKEICKFYMDAFSIEIAPNGVNIKVIQEIHDRRHLHVHRGGYADDQYINTYKNQDFKSGDLVTISEEYFLSSLSNLEASALHIKQALEKMYPTPPHLMRRYNFGSLELPEYPESLQFLRFRVLSEKAKLKYFDVDQREKNNINKLVLWASTDDKEVRLIVGGSEKEIKRFRKQLHLESQKGDIQMVESYKIKRKSKSLSMLDIAPNKNNQAGA